MAVVAFSQKKRKTMGGAGMDGCQDSQAYFTIEQVCPINGSAESGLLVCLWRNRDPGYFVVFLLLFCLCSWQLCLADCLSADAFECSMPKDKIITTLHTPLSGKRGNAVHSHVGEE